MEIIRKLVLALMLAAYGQAWGGFYDGFALYEQGDYATALREFRPLAEQGNAFAQLYLGVMYDNGYGVPQNYREAVKWWRQSAEQGVSVAEFNLGVMYETGHGAI